MSRPPAAALRLVLAALPLCLCGPAAAGTAPKPADAAPAAAPAPGPASAAAAASITAPAAAQPFAPTEAARAAVTALIARAHALRLGEDAHWLRLGHWRRRLNAGYLSEAVGADFFLDTNGRTDPAAELDATLKGIFGVRPPMPDELARGLMPAVCRFPARILVLQQKLGFDPAGLAPAECPRLADFFRKLQPAGVSLIFSSHYLNNPASAFGHTFLRVQRQGEQLGREQRELLDSAVDYSADTDATNPIGYALGGLLGFFPGTFKLRPYYYKVREYNDYESRDLWEYQLALTPLEVATFAAHVFELGSTWFSYYYIDQNCSYHVLAALEAASPRLRLLEHLGSPVVPADTIKALYRTPGLVQSVTYRPSATTQFEARVAGMARTDKLLVDDLARQPALPLPGLAPAGQVLLLDAAADLIDVRFAKELTFQPDGAAGQLKQALLARRAALLVPSPELAVPQPAHQPHQAHASSRLSVGAVWSDADGAAASLGWRYTLHSLDDPPGGYPDLAQIQFFPLELRVQGRSGQVVVERLHFLDAVSLHAMNLFDHRLSWKIRAGAARVRDAGCKSCLVADLLLGTGAAFDLGPLVAFGTFDLSVQAGPELQGIEGARAIRAGAGPAGGLRLRLGERVTWLLQSHAYWLPKAAGPWTWGAETSLRVQVGAEVGLGLEGRALPEATEGSLLLYWFF